MSSVLLRPLLYLSIQHDSKRLTSLNWWLPVAVSAALVCAGALLAPSLNLFHKDGLIDKLLGFVQSLPGFYMAALSAVATFGKADLDEVMPGVPPRARILYNGQRVMVDLTRRRFLCLMFAYLTALSIAVTLACIVIVTCVDVGRAWPPAGLLDPLRGVLAFGLVLLTSQMIVITLWGLYYLGERMHTPDK